MCKLQEKRKARKKKTAEDFTPEHLTNQILNKLNEYGPESWEEGKTFCDPACGDGGLLVPVLKRKLSLSHDPLVSIQSVYGCDIMADNVSECRTRLLEALQDANVVITHDHIKAVLKNIVWTSLKNYKNGSLDYDFSFKKNPKKRDIDNWYNKFTNGNNVSTEDVEETREETLFDVL